MPPHGLFSMKMKVKETKSRKHSFPLLEHQKKYGISLEVN